MTGSKRFFLFGRRHAAMCGFAVWVGLLGGAGVARAPAVQPIELALVPADDMQPGGPDYDFLIGRFEIQNDRFVTFLNDAKARLDDPRGQYLYFDVDSGDVYIHSAESGAVGEVGEGTFIFRVSANPHVSYDGTSESYTVAGGFEQHPVTGVSWYGALKFCNWLTIDAGLPPTQRAYLEGPSSDLLAWRPVTIARLDWSFRDLNSSERDALLQVRGFRLPMDGGDTGNEPGSYNEWFKAAAWNRSSGVDRLFGFGRDTIGSADANYRCSGDPFEDAGDCIAGSTTPVGYYDGSLRAGGFQTNANDNAYGLFDLSGNVWEWMQDQAFDPVDRRNRGGSFRNSETALLLAGGAERLADSANDATGFRVVLVQQVIGSLAVVPEVNLTNTGVWGGPYDQEPTSLAYRITNVGDTDLALLVTVDRPWVAVEPTELQPLLPTASIEVTVTINPNCTDGLPVGTSNANVRFLDQGSGSATFRRVSLSASEPMSVTPVDVLSISMPFGGIAVPSETTFTVSSTSDTPINWSARSVDVTDSQSPVEPASWILLDGATVATGVVPSQGIDSVVVMIDQEVAADLPVGAHRAEVRFTNDCTETEFVRTVVLTVTPPFVVSPPDEVTTTGVCGGPFSPSDFTYTITNQLGEEVGWSAAADDPLLVGLDPVSGTLASQGEADITVTILPAVDDLSTGDYPVLLSFAQPSTGFEAVRTVVIAVTPTAVDPEEDVRFSGPQSGPFDPASFTFTVRNTGIDEMEWTASFLDTSNPPAPRAWIDFSSEQGVILNPNGIALVAVSVAPDASLLSPGRYSGVVTFTSSRSPGQPASCPAERSVSLVVGGEAVSVPMVMVPAEDIQTGGPSYLFRMGRFEITNTAYARFLNDALENSTTDRGANLDHGSPPTGLVTLSGDATVVFDASVGQAIQFVDGGYVVVAGKENHPVVGVSWYGAVKYCNWLTLAQGMDDPDQRAYLEGPTATDWVPVLSDPALLVADVRGFRLPIDGGTGDANPFNEWFKAASRKGVDADGDAVFGAVYGFGRDVLSNRDANYFASGDTADDEPTPVGFFNGISTLAGDGAVTRDTSNGYGFHDLCGNVSEWMHDEGTASDQRAVRGGHFNNVIDSPSLRSDTRGSLQADQPYAFVGFRIVQTLETSGLVVTQQQVRSEGFVGGPFTPDSLVIRLENPGAQTIDGIEVGTDASWLVVDGVSPTQVPPGGMIDVPFRIEASTTQPSVSPSPSGDFVLVPGRDAPQPGGPDYDFWIGRGEVTNGQFAAFLNDARTNAALELPAKPDARSQHMYFELGSGSVFINDREAGEEGTDAPSATRTTMLYDSTVGRIAFAGDRYVVESGFENHPVVGVTWYGAVKYCNWLSLSKGIPESLLAYTEAPSPDLDQWGPVIVGDPRQWVRRSLGFRLPMDDGASEASAFNEWYTAAAWDASSGGGGVNHLFGFGRDTLTAPDANYLASGDTFEDGTTPGHFFNGARTLFQEASNCFPALPEPTVTVDTDNAFGLVDLCGNVAEWVQDVGAAPGERGTRGGSWRDPIDSLFLTNTVRGSQPASQPRDDIGFRVVAGTGRVVTVTVVDRLFDETHTRRFIVDTVEPFELDPCDDISLGGTYGDGFAALPNPLSVCIVTNRSDLEMGWTVGVDQDWLDVGERDTGAQNGTVAAGAGVALEMRTNDSADSLRPGTHTATVRVRNQETSAEQTATFELVIDQPVRFEPSDPDPQAFSGRFGGPFEQPMLDRTFTLSSDVSFDLTYTVSVNQPWLTIDSIDPLSGLLVAQGVLSFDVSVNDQADLLGVGTYEADLRVTWFDPANNDLSSNVEQKITLAVDELMDITQPSDPWRVEPDFDANALPTQRYELTGFGSGPIDVTVTTDQSWLVATPAFVELLPGFPVGVDVSLTEAALQLFDGAYEATIRFEDEVTGAVQCRTVALLIEETLSVDPFADFVTAGVVGGPFAPTAKTYTLSNVARDQAGPIQWRASVVTPGVDWLLFNAATTDEGTLADGESTHVVVSVDPARTTGLAGGTYEAIIEFADLTNGEQMTRTVTMTLAVPQFVMDEAPIGASVAQPGGPAYGYFVERSHTTNAEFAAFLNDALMNPENERGQYLFFDTTTGDVFLNDAQGGESGANPGSRTTLVFDADGGARIEFVDGVYRVVTSPVDYALHPVTGVSWYGALKYGNWLTIDQGMLPSQRCYTEDTSANLAGWHPVTISTTNWLLRDLNDAERALLVNRYRGYRLLMDDGAGNSSSAVDAADAYNEWYVSAAWNPLLEPARNTSYGFGRDAITGTDANFLGSGDPFDEGTTPVGFFADANANAFGLLDMTGNVYQWMQGRFNSHPDSIDFRTIRGGGWNDPAGGSGLRSDSRSFTMPSLTNDQIGFRVVRTLARPTGDFNGDGVVNGADFSDLINGLTGPGGGILPEWTVFDFNEDGNLDLSDFARFQTLFNPQP